MKSRRTPGVMLPHGGLLAAHPWLSALRRNWIAEAELNLPTEPADRRLAFGFTFRDDAEAAALCAAVGLPAPLVDEGRRFMDKLDLVPRHWFKLSMVDGAVTRYARYFAFVPSTEPPLTGVRLLLRRLGAPSVDAVAAIMSPLAGRAQVSWFVSREDGQETSTRLSCGLPADELPAYLDVLVEKGLVDGAAAHAVVARRRDRAADLAYLTLRPGDSTSCAVDYRLSTSPHRYVKVRPNAPERGYAPLVDALTEEEISSLETTTPCLEAVRDWYARWREAVGYNRTVKSPPPPRWPEGPVLDAGCGASLAELREHGTEAVGLTLGDVPEGVSGDFHDLPFESGQFAGIQFVESLSHAIDPARALAEARRVLQPGGRLRVVDVFLPDGEPDTRTRLEHAELVRTFARRALRLEALTDAIRGLDFDDVVVRQCQDQVAVHGILGKNEPTPTVGSPFLQHCLRRLPQLSLRAYEVQARAAD